MDFLKWESVRARQRACQSRPVSTAAPVQLRRSVASGVGFAGLQSCGSMMCPHCGGKIAAVRRDDITRGVTNWRATGGTVLFGTLTLRHRTGQSLDLLASAVADCWEFATKGRQWARDRADNGIAGFTRVWETTYSGKAGWHQHVHFLLFIEPGNDVQVAALLASIFGRWSRRSKVHGLAAPLLVGQDLHAINGDDAADLMGDYFAKQAGATANTAPTAIGWEVAGGSGKNARRGGASPVQLLDLAMEGNGDALALWYEYELAMTGRRTIAWSRGLRDLLGLDDERTDEEIAAEEAGTVDDVVVSIPLPTWRKLVNAGDRGPLVVFASDERHTAGQIAAWCARRGWPVIVGNLQPQDEAAAG